jgi:hypothetical protein
MPYHAQILIISITYNKQEANNPWQQKVKNMVSLGMSLQID